MYARNIKLTDLWSLENLGISNPTLEESKQNSYEDALDDFQQKLTIPNGRYELQLPWKHDPVNLPDNKATLPPKLLLQESRKLELSWDSELPKNINKFMKWANEMYLLKVTVPLYIAINETSELHIFVDASKSSYGACVFVRTVVENDVKVTLLSSKARVAPLKSLTIPRLELMSCCLGARLANSIIRALNLPGIKVIYWFDSEVALWWIREQGNWSVFVANRGSSYEVCRRYSSNSLISEPVSLPADRADANAFDITGIDLAGPLFTRDGDGLIAHLTRPETIYTDNGTNFVGTNSELKNLDWDKIMQETDINPIKWKFNPPTAAWWERLVREIKKLLKRTLGKKRIRYRRKLIHDFRSRFRKEYLSQLRQKRPGKPGHDFKVDVVMIEEPSKKRVYWPLGKVISLLPGRDGKVRTLKLKCKNSELIRPIQRVYPFEVPVINNEIVKIHGVPTSNVNEDKLTSNAVIKSKVTRSGRLVKIPERLGLFNEVIYTFE
ncbi:integrase catalytic domain-containing protein [Trichonephila clavipes]|nr:integrase catalytic domain-containing protein [Trichonephila clavipes]